PWCDFCWTKDSRELLLPPTELPNSWCASSFRIGGNATRGSRKASKGKGYFGCNELAGKVDKKPTRQPHSMFRYQIDTIQHISNELEREFACVGLVGLVGKTPGYAYFSSRPDGTPCSVQNVFLDFGVVWVDCKNFV